MALDKQKILHELGSVVNQLQSADCGCMGKLFTNSGQDHPNQMSAPPAANCYRGGCNGFNSPCGGEPCPGHCTAFRSAPKLYADTYNYLNKNLMQPVIQEVYDDLKSINAGNTVMNNPMGAQMGLSAANNADQRNPRIQNAMPTQGHNHHMPRCRFGNVNVNSVNQNEQGMGQNIGQMGQVMDHGMGQGMGGGMGHGMGPGIGHGTSSGTDQGMSYGIDQKMTHRIGQVMEPMNQGMGHMNQGMSHMDPSMGQINKEMVALEPGMDHGMHKMPSDGSYMTQEAYMAQDRGYTGYGGPMVHEGQKAAGYGMGQMRHGMGQAEYETGQGQEMAQMGYEMGQAGHGMGQGQGMTQMGYEMGQAGQRIGQERQGQSGHGIGQLGPGMGQMGHDISEMGQGMGQMGHGIRNMGQEMHPSGGMMGMGPQIVNMMNKAGKNSASLLNSHASATPDSSEMGQLHSNMTDDAYQGQFNTNHLQNNGGYMDMNNMAQGGEPVMQTNHLSQATNSNKMPDKMNNINTSPKGMGSMNSNSNNNNRYGQHSAGINKFNEMFSGLFKGDLGFDPMAIAIQMNPANQQQAAMNTMQSLLMGGNKRNVQPSINMPSVMQPIVNDMTNQQPGQQGQAGDATGGSAINNNQIPQQMYTAQSGSPNAQRSTTQEQQLNQQQGQQEQVYNPQEQTNQSRHQVPRNQRPQREMMNTNKEFVVSGALPTMYEGSEDPNLTNEQRQPVQSPKDMYREPIFPADTSRNLLQSHHFSKPERFFDYNTLGQPVEMLPASRYRIPESNLPQTLSPQPVKFSNVKNTVSKTALMGNKPIGITPSKSQLQHIYNTYKGSQSFTQQNIRPSHHINSYSAGQINVPRAQQDQLAHQTPIERVGGDTLANNYNKPVLTKLEPCNNMEQIGDVPAAKKPDNDYARSPANNNKLRNGLQDQVFSAAPKSAKWSFHGTDATFSTGYRFRSK